MAWQRQSEADTEDFTCGGAKSEPEAKEKFRGMIKIILAKDLTVNRLSLFEVKPFRNLVHFKSKLGLINQI